MCADAVCADAVCADAVCADEDLKRFRQVFVELLPMGVRLLERPHTLGVMLVQRPAHGGAKSIIQQG